ncbi:MAG TPA: DNA-processing protein DprA, partial [Flavobacterium sp.]|nr:DNA-processing protein DprA [Flavobacterium sp.]
APELFIRRNRIIAGLSQATVVIESAETGGSLSTAFFAMEYAREVYAIPGKITDTYSKGCLKLIQQHKAQLLFDFQQIADDLNWNLLKKDEQIKPEPILDLTSFSETEQKILKCLQTKPLHIDDLAIKTQLDMSALNANLLMLELNGVVVGLQGKMFQMK